VLRSSDPSRINPLNRRRAITLTPKQFEYAWANALDDDEARRLHETFHLAGSGLALHALVDEVDVGLEGRAGLA
jgi:hypothetical protein